MKILIITVAGMSSRFSQSLGQECLKCIYYRSDITESLLYRMIYQEADFDRYIIVGGFLFGQLNAFVEQYLSDFADKIILVKNEKYAEYGSGYSLYRGLQEAMRYDFEQIVFAEGDLFVDGDSFRKILESPGDVITCNREAIRADKAVAFYYDQTYGIHYIYDTSHNALQITEPFLGIYNSGQIWKFAQAGRLKRVYENMKAEDWQGTNLVLVQRYFEGLVPEEYELVSFETWVNCNTIFDFEKIR